MVPDPADLAVSRETMARLDVFVGLLLRWRTTIRLVGTATPDEIWKRHIADALQLRSHIPKDLVSAADIGSGAGFPGLVLAIATGIRFALIEQDHRKAAFLVEACRLTEAAADVVVEDVRQTRLPRQPLVTARAFAPLPGLLACVSPILAADGVALLLKGRGLAEELRHATRRHTLSARVLAASMHDGYILECRQLGA